MSHHPQMTLSELRAELERRGLSLSGTKAALEMRLAQTLVTEIMGEDAAAAMQLQTGEVQEEEEVRHGYRVGSGFKLRCTSKDVVL